MKQGNCSSCGQHSGLHPDNTDFTEGAMCVPCFEDELDRQEADEQKGFSIFRAALSLENQAKWDGLEIHIQRFIYYSAIEDEIITFEIKGR